jgi:hypothetical protein
MGQFSMLPELQGQERLQNDRRRLARRNQTLVPKEKASASLAKNLRTE